MSQRFEEDFNALGNIYEAYFAKKAGGQSDLAQGSPSYDKNSFSPNGSINPWAANNGLPQTTSPIESEETSPLMDKIDALIKEAESDGMDYAFLQLKSLKKFIEEQG